MRRRQFIGSLASLVPIVAQGARNDVGKIRVMQGPMLGAVTATSARIWLRTSESCTVAIHYRRDGGETAIAMGTTASESDFTTVVELRDLEPAAQYHYAIHLDGDPAPELRNLGHFSLQTAPSVASSFTVAFGSCARYVRDPVQAIWNGVRARNPDLFFWLGDNVYGDSRRPGALAEEYRRQRDVIAFRPLGASVPQLAVWDDHDYALNDHDRTNPVKDEALRVFKNYWANPGYGQPENPGVYFAYRYAGVDFFFLDVRYYRDPNAAEQTPTKTMLGTEQLNWLKAELRQSSAVFKVLISGSGWSQAKGTGGDSWASFVHQRNVLFDFIRDEEISGVVLLSGDTHVAELNCIPWSMEGGYDLYDFTSSPLAQNTTDSWLTRFPEARIRPVYFRSANFGLLSFSFHGTPTVSYTVCDASSRQHWEPVVLTADQLRNGVESWRELQSPGLPPAFSGRQIRDS